MLDTGSWMLPSPASSIQYPAASIHPPPSRLPSPASRLSPPASRLPSLASRLPPPASFLAYYSGYTSMKKNTKDGKNGDEGTVQKKDIPGNADNKIDQDFPGYPHGQSNEKVINPKTKKEKETSDTDNKDGEKINYKSDEEELEDDGSGGAFEGTENPRE
ncbi:MAG: hypothetical protein H7Y42_10050 [Chitinophagaceae bacterium]|nr:hypothetical protein [Chitinophagaceae bacterium]